jgi:hypothetical protein
LLIADVVTASNFAVAFVLDCLHMEEGENYFGLIELWWLGIATA